MPSRGEPGTSGKSARQFRLVNQPLSQEDVVNTYKATQFCQRCRLKAFFSAGRLLIASLPPQRRNKLSDLREDRRRLMRCYWKNWCDLTAAVPSRRRAMSRRERQAGLERCEKQIRWAIDYHREQFRGRDDGSLSEAQKIRSWKAPILLNGLIGIYGVMAAKDTMKRM